MKSLRSNYVAFLGKNVRETVEELLVEIRGDITCRSIYLTHPFPNYLLGAVTPAAWFRIAIFLSSVLDSKCSDRRM